MAERKKDTGRVNGSLAYDLEKLVREQERAEAERARQDVQREEQYALRRQQEEERRRQEEEERRLARERREKQRAAQPAPVPRTKGHVSMAALIGIPVAAVMVVMLLMGYIQVAQVSSQVAGQKAELDKVQRENVALVTEYEETFDMATIKKAGEDSGMSKPSAGQVEYVELGGPDTAVVYDTQHESLLDRTLKSVQELVGEVVEFFR